jgi:hypothetical protein
MTTLNKILIALGSLILVAALGVIIYLQHEMKVQQTTIANSQIAQQQLINGITQSSSQFATKSDLDNFITQNGVNLKTVQDAVDKLNGTITAANTIQVNSQGQAVKNGVSSSNGPVNPNPVATTTVPCTGSTAVCPNADPFGYQKTQQNLVLNEDFAPSTQVPWGNAGFSAWSNTPWTLNVYPRQYNVDNVVATDTNGQVAFFNKFTIVVNGQTYTLPITTAKTVQQVPTASFSFNPRPLIGIAGGIALNPVQGEFSPNLDLALFSYGQFKTTPDLSIAAVGIGYGVISRKPELLITPITFNIGKIVPLLHNTYFGPSVFLDTSGNFGALLGLQVGL